MPMAKMPEPKKKGVNLFNDEESEEEEFVKPVKKPLVQNILA